MKPVVKLSEVADHINMVSDEAVALYNELTGEFFYYNEGFTDDDDDRDLDDLDEEEGWIQLPSQLDADEYGMMSDFADSISNARKREQLEIALSGRGAFRRFKDAVIREDIAEAWYSFRDMRYLEFARDWCDENKVPYDSAELPSSAAESTLAHTGIYMGKSATATTTVTEHNTAKALVSGSVEVFSTPMMIALMEQAACQCLADGLEDGQTSVGTAVSVEHTAASPIGMEITATAVIEGIEGRKIAFEVTARDNKGEIGHGTHERFIVVTEGFMAKAGARR
jgi:predicted thioesterase